MSRILQVQDSGGGTFAQEIHVDGRVYRCRQCRGLFEDFGFRCGAMHSSGLCCHYGMAVLEAPPSDAEEYWWPHSELWTLAENPE